MEKQTNSQKTNKVFMVWQDGDDEKYWSQFDSLEDAVSSEGDGTEVWMAEPKKLGTFKRAVEIVKVKRKKPTKMKKK